MMKTKQKEEDEKEVDMRWKLMDHPPKPPSLTPVQLLKERQRQKKDAARIHRQLASQRTAIEAHGSQAARRAAAEFEGEEGPLPEDFEKELE